MHVVIFEDSRWSDFAPLSLSRPVFGLRSGATSLLEKQLRGLQPARVTLWVRPEMEAVCRRHILPELAMPTEINRPLNDEPALLINAATIGELSCTSLSDEAIALDSSGAITLAYVRRQGLGAQDVLGNIPRWIDLLGLPQTLPKPRTATSLVDLIYANEDALVEDFVRLPHPSATKPAGPYHYLNPERIWLGSGVNLSPGCVLDASKGPVMIGSGATIGANAVIVGPCSVGPGARIRPLTQVRESTSIGAGCTIGGEVSNAIFMSHSNKGHEGFVGHSYIGEWANLGSGTTTSNLKNTYGEIHARVGNREIPTGRQFLGSVIGDHSKTAILTRLTAGTYIGFCSMITVTGTAPRMVPSFTFLTDAGAEPYRMDKAMEVAKRVFARRDRQFDEIDRQLMRYVQITASEIER
jgi:UDP-N-acetylglucosamine diphosphorylase/glucosamine-1-phosphate N-acetyltransferase